MDSTIYDSIILTKTSEKIPVLKNGRTIESRYNPESEAEKTITLNKLCETDKILLILGTGSGILIKEIIKKFPYVTIIAVEYSVSDINFLRQIESLSEIYSNKNVIFSDIQSIQENLVKYYNPALYGNLKIIPNTAWIEEVRKQGINIQERIQDAVKIISADYSVQAHFGKIWQKNILLNLKLASNLLNNAEKNSIQNIQNEKKAVIIGAGPSVDSKIEYLKKERNKLILISTDTAFQILTRNGIEPDFAVSLDGQLVSQNHFYNAHSSHTVFLLSLTSQNSAARKIVSSGNKIQFFSTSHPLELFAKNNGYKFPSFYSGSGTVTIAALDFALQAGFKNLQIIGADFSYHNGKAYAKGTYLDSLYSLNSNRIHTSEHQFCSLMFRTELKTADESSLSENKEHQNRNLYPAQKIFTTKVLESYRHSLENYLELQGIQFTKNNFDYELTCLKNNKLELSWNYKADFNKFKDSVCNTLKSSIENKDFHENIFFVLPYIAYLRTKNQKKECNVDFESLIKLAYTNIVGYNI